MARKRIRRMPDPARRASPSTLVRAAARGRSRSEGSFRRFIENLSEGYFFYRHDRNRVYHYLSPSVTRVLGYSPEAYVAAYATLFTDNPMNAAAAKSTNRALRGKPQHTFEVEVRAADGSLHRLEITEYPVFDAKGAVEFVEGIAHDVTEKRRLEARLQELATRDELTGLFNRRHFCYRLNEALNLARLHDYPVTVALIDLDGLKKINDTYGHASGDRMICAAGAILERELRRGDTVGRMEGVAGRLGGDEFALVLPFATATQARTAMERVLATFAAECVEVGLGITIPVRASIGIAEYERSLDASALQARADQALYQSKNAARGQITLWSKT